MLAKNHNYFLIKNVVEFERNHENMESSPGKPIIRKNSVNTNITSDNQIIVMIDLDYFFRAKRIMLQSVLSLFYQFNYFFKVMATK